MKQLNTNQKLFNGELIKLLEKHNLNDADFSECAKALFPKTFKNYSKKYVQIEEFDAKSKVNEFIKDKTLRGTGVYKIVLSPHTAQYLVIYYKEKDEVN